MFGITVNKAFLDIYPNTVFSGELNSPLYLGDDADILTLSMLFTTTLPLTALNQRLLRHPSVIDNDERFIEGAESSIYVKGVELFAGTLEVVSSKKREVNVRVLINFATVLKEMRMRDLDLGIIDITFTNAYTLAKLTAQNPEDYNYVFTPVWNPSFWGESDVKLDITKEIQNYWLIGRDDNGQFLDTAMTPFPKISHVLERIFQKAGLSLNNQWQLTTELKRLLLYTNASMCSKTYEFGVLQFVLASGLSDTTPIEFLKHLSRKFGLGVFANLITKEAEIIPFKTIIERPAAHNWTNKILSDYTLAQDITTPSVLSDKLKDSILPSDIEKLIQYPLYPSDLEGPEGIYTSGESTWYHKNLIPLGVGVPLAIRQFSRARLKNYYTTTNTTGSKYENGIGTLVQSKLPSFADADYMPSLKLRGKYEPNETEDYASEDRIFFYRGLQLNHNGALYPVSSAETFYIDNVRTPIPEATKSLDWNGDDGLYEQSWKEIINVLLNAKRLTLPILLTVKDIQNFSFKDKIRIKNREYLVKKLKITLSRQGLQPTEAELISLPS